MNKSRTQYRYMVTTEKGQFKNWDFIQNSDLFYYYKENTLLNEVVYNRVLQAFNQWRHEVIQGEQHFSWDQFTKMPYLYKSLGAEQQLRFPLIFNQNQLFCGGGRYFVVYNYFKHIQLNSIIISPEKLNLPQLNSVCELEEKLLSNTWIQNNVSKKTRFAYHLKDNIVVATDLTKNIRNQFPFCKNSERNIQLKQQIHDVLHDSHARNQSIESALKTICQILI